MLRAWAPGEKPTKGDLGAAVSGIFRRATECSGSRFEWMPTDLRYGGFHIVCDIKSYSEFFFAKRYGFGCNFCFAPSHLTKRDREGRTNKLHIKVCRLAFLCLPWSQTEKKPPCRSYGYGIQNTFIHAAVPCSDMILYLSIQFSLYLSLSIYIYIHIHYCY